MRPDLNLLKAFRGSDGSESSQALLVGGLGIVLLWARAPFATSNFYAEDGTIFLTGARSSGLFESLKEPVAGYFHFVPRLIGAASAQVPLTRAPLMTGLLVLFVVAWANMTIYLASNHPLSNRWYRALLALSVTLLPIVGFESISNSTNLHFILVCASLVVLMGAQKTPWRRLNDSMLVIVTGLSTPLVLVLLPVAGYRWWRDRRGEVSQTISLVVVGWALGTAGQFGLMVSFGQGSRRWGGDPGVARSLVKTLFLLFERVLGYNFLPFWPRISAEDYSHGVTSDLVVRALILAAFGGLLAVFFLRSVRVGLRCKETIQVLSVVVPLSVGIGYWLFLATMFSAEPRYAIFPAFCVLYALLTSVEIYTGPGRKKEWEKWPKVLLVPLVVVVGFASHWTPSEIRSDGPTWSAGLHVAAEDCSIREAITAKVPIIPTYADWNVELDCEELLSAVGGVQP